MSRNVPYVDPEHLADAFNCPHCGAFANMNWGQLVQKHRLSMGQRELNWFESSICTNCNNVSLWFEEELFYPANISVEPPNSDMPQNAKKDYLEASLVLPSSPRSAAALLRQSIQKICDELITGNDNLNKKIGKLVDNGLDVKIQQSLDVVRVIGNESVHPGQIDLNDTPDVALSLFKLVNLITRRMITEPKEIATIYKALPSAKIEGIKKRDDKAGKDSKAGASSTK